MAKKNSKRKIVGYILFGLFTALSLVAGIPKLFGLSFALENMANLGYGQAFTHVLGALWVMAAIGVWIKKYRIMAALGALFIMPGAIAAHITAGDPIPWMLLIHISVFKGVLFYEDFHKKLGIKLPF